ncbi:MAG TPA: hypothetical protein PLV83_00940 [Bacilli bacterium]|nr:hypothetical protein [Bacilli bacterium]
MKTNMCNIYKGDIIKNGKLIKEDAILLKNAPFRYVDIDSINNIFDYIRRNSDSMVITSKRTRGKAYVINLDFYYGETQRGKVNVLTLRKNPVKR